MNLSQVFPGKVLIFLDLKAHCIIIVIDRRARMGEALLLDRLYQTMGKFRCVELYHNKSIYI